MTQPAAGALPRGRHNLSREQVATAQRARMIAATAAAMAEHGYANTPVAAIIKRAGVSRETFYQQFSSKQDCFLAALEDALAGLSARMGSLPAGGTPVERFDRLVGAYLDVLARAPQFARLFLIEIYAAGPEVAQRRAELQQPFVDGLVELFAVRTERGRFAVRAVVAAIVSLATSCLAAGEPEKLPALRGPIVTFAAEVLGHDGEPPAE